MCGIAGIILKDKAPFSLSAKVAEMSLSLAHRGPDGEGFMLSDGFNTYPFKRSGSEQIFSKKELAYIPQKDLTASNTDSIISFAHRRLSIIDLSEAGHQPMSTPDSKLWITFNGEIYNYIELKKELKESGYLFISESDTEVILHAYKHWGFDCVNKFNGMWAFCIFDTEKQLCFASRDRLGVKPFYYINTVECMAFASEQKAFVSSGLIKASYNYKAAHDYLVNGSLETETNNFFDGIEELFPGNNLIYNLKTKAVKIEKYYKINQTQNNEKLSDRELIDLIEQKLYNAVKLRLRSDVEVGACLSGGIDSSVLCGLMHKILNKSNYCFTSVFKNETFNEEYFADVVAKQINAVYFKTEPTLEGFINELDSLVYSQDIPVWDTSTYAQYKVMALAKSNNIKVVIDGQGADELFGGYHHHFVAKWNNMMGEGKTVAAVKDINKSGKTIDRPFKFYIKEKLKGKLHFNSRILSGVFKTDFLKSQEIQNPTVYFNDINKQLINDIEQARLKSFLKCEDRCAMWHSVESRTPFSDDIELIDLMFSFNGNRKIQNGVSKYLLREASKAILPQQIYSRYDKRGFETPMKKWVKELKPLMTKEIEASGFDFIRKDYLEKLNTENAFEYKLLFRLFILSRWKKVFIS
ncbi:MAG: asnB [Bacteroidetes bacterium]|nr:asnB [Bacteroidota bacterium]